MSLSPRNVELKVERRPRQGGIIDTFPKKLHTMLIEILKTSDCSDIIRWGDDGFGFVITRPETFTSIVLPKFFRTSKFSSFQRQLNAYGFIRGNLYAGEEDGYIYRHKMFHRDHPELLSKIKRRNGTAQSQISTMKTTQHTSTPELQQSSCHSLSLSPSAQVASPRKISMNHIVLEFSSPPYDRHVGLLGKLSSGVNYDASSVTSSDWSDDTDWQDSILDEAAALVHWRSPCTVASSSDVNQNDEDPFIQHWNPDQERLVSRDD